MDDHTGKKCPICHGTKFVENLDELSCVTCGHRLEGHLSQVNFVEGDGAFSNFRLMSQSQSQRTPNRADSNSEDEDSLGGSLKIGHRAKKRRHAKLQKREVSYHVYFEAMQFVLEKQVDILVSKCGVTNKVRDTVFEYWYKYVRMCIQSKMDFENIFLYHRFAKWKTRKQNLFRKWKENCNASIEYTDDHSDGSDVEDALSQPSEDSYRGIEDEEAAENSSHAVLSRPSPPQPQLLVTLSILYISCLHWRETITVQDLETWADNGTIPYWFAYDTIIPLKMQGHIADAKTFFRGHGYPFTRRFRWRASQANENEKYWFENRIITRMANRLVNSFGGKLPRLNLPALTLRISYSIGMPDNVSKITAMASGILSHLNHWAICKPGGKHPGGNKYTTKKHHVVSHRRSYLCIACLLVLSLEQNLKCWYDVVLEHIPLGKENIVAHLFRKQVPTLRNVGGGSTSRSSEGSRSTDATAISLQGERRGEMEKYLFLQSQTTSRVPWTLEEASHLPKSSLTSYLNFCESQFKQNQRRKTSSNSFERIANRFKRKDRKGKIADVYKTNKIDPGNALLSATSRKKIQIPGKCLLARKRLFNHVGSFIGESAQAVESMYKKIRKDEMVIDLLYSCKDVIE